MLKKLIHFLSVLSILGLFLALMAMPSAPSGVASAQSEEIPVPLPRGCRGVAPLDDPDACCAFGYVYYNDVPIAGATVRIESADATWEGTTGNYGVSDDAHYQVDLTGELDVAPGDVITITVSYNDMVSTRTWTVQPGSQQVDVGLIEGYQATSPLSANTALDQPAPNIQAEGYTAVLAGASNDSEAGQLVANVANLSSPDMQAITTGKSPAPTLEEEETGRHASITTSDALNIPETRLLASDGAAEDSFGNSVTIDGNVAIVGAYQDDDNGTDSGAAYIYRWDGSQWQEESKLLASDGAEGDGFGRSVSIDGNVALVGAFQDDGKGSAYIYHWDGSQWREESKLLASDGAEGDYFGYSVSIDGNVALVGAYKDDDNGERSGSAYIYRWDGTQWQEESKLLASDGANNDYFGLSVSIDGNVALVGARGDDDNGRNSGSAYIFRWDGSQWQEESKLLPSDGAVENQFGYSVSIDSSNNVALVGARGDDDNGPNSGSAYIYRWDGSQWQEESKLLPSDGAEADRFGYSVSINGNMALVGAYYEDDNGLTNNGAAYLYRWHGSQWVEESKLLASDYRTGDAFGTSVSTDGNRALIGAIGDEGRGANSGSAYVYDLSITVSRVSLSAMLREGESSSQTLVISNIGTSDLDWQASGSAAWLSVTPASGTIALSPSVSLTVGIDASELSPGVYTDTLTITSNDPNRSSIDVPVSLVVLKETETKLLASDGARVDWLGYSVSIDEDVAIVGTRSNKAYIYRWDGSQWQEKSKLLPSDGANEDEFGGAVSIDGDVAIVGALRDDDNGTDSGSAYIYRWDGSQWQEESKLLPSDGGSNEHFGTSVSIDGNVAFVGAFRYDLSESEISFSGSVYVYRWDGSQWQEESKLLPNDLPENHRFGFWMSIDGDVALISDDISGAVYVYRWDGSQWQESKLPINGSSVSIDGDVALIGHPSDNTNGVLSGSAYIYRWDGRQWVEEAKLTPSDGASREFFGWSVSIDGNMALVGAYWDDDNGYQSGSAYIYRWDGSQWREERKLLPSDGGSHQEFGYSVSIGGNWALVGNPKDDDNGSVSGAAYMYDLSAIVNEPDIAVSPDSISVRLGEGESSSETLVISNTGEAALTFELSEQASSSDAWDGLAFPAEKVESGLADEIQTLGEGDFLLYLSEQADLSQAYTMSDWQARGEYVRRTLWETAQESQADLRAFLDSEVQSGNVSAYQSFYLVNAIQVSGTFATLDSLAQRDDVAYIEGVKEFTIPEPEIVSGNSIDGVEWGVSKIRADQAWDEFGVRGNGIVVANIDTGVLNSHATLLNQYRGTATGSHDYNWFDPSGIYPTAPGDNNGHGTHVMGTMVGSDGSSNQIGVAPEAQWIAAKGCASNSCSLSHLLAAAEWVLAPYPIGGTPANGDASKRPHVVNNSWSGSGGSLWYQASVNAWRAADIFPAFAAGNSGPNAGTVRSPGDYAESFASGATDSADTIASFSSRGPSSLTNETKPDVSAPGVSVRSASNDGGYRHLSGTSMASPHTAGCVALIKATKPSLNVATIEELLTNTATDLGSSGPDDDYGHGQIDCYEAIASLNRRPDVPWLALNPTTGNVEPDNSQNINVTVDSTGLAAGTYRASIGVSSNDPDEAFVEVPVTLVVGGSYEPPTAAFSASVVEGGAPLTVQFANESSGDITSWTWDFGDGTISGARYPEHEYTLPGTYTVSLTVSGPGGEDSETKEAYITINPPDEVNTLILTNRKKVAELHGAFAATELMGKLGELAAHERVQGLVIAVENEPSVATAYAEWDANPTSTEKANAVTSAIKDVIDSKLADYPDVEYIVVAGDDRVIPFRRVRDKTWYYESRYRNQVSCDSVTGAALCNNMTLTDDYYAHRVPLVPRHRNWDGQPLYVPYFAIGRLIETPTEMIAQIDTFLADSRIPANDAVVTGYTFVTDAAEKNCDVLTNAGVETDCSLIGQHWNKSDFINNALNGSPELVSINGHADHYRFGAPIGSPVTSDEIANASGISQRAIYYTIGCHSGLNLSPENPNSLDTAQAFAQQQANYVGNTGYGYGYLYSVGLSERLMVDFSNQLTRYGATTLGEALTAAKQQYYLRSHRFGYYDEKILIESTLYGLPMYQVTSASAQRAPTEEELPEGVIVEEVPIALDGEFSKTQLTFGLPALTEETTDNGTYYTLGGLVHAEHGEPIQPRLPFEVSIPGTNAHGLVFKGGTYSDINNFDPVIAEAVTLTLPSAASVLAELPFTETNWYPAIPSQLNTLDNGAQAQMTALLGQYHSTYEGGTERLYTELSFDVYYHSDSDDWTAPTITSVNSQLATDTATVTVATSDDSGIHDVLVTHTDQNGTWQSTSLTDNGDAWSGSFSATTNTDFFVQVVDKAGNVTVDDNHGAYYEPPSEPGDGPQIALVAGWNLISLPVHPENTAIADVLAGIAGNYSAVYAYDGCDTQDHWKSYDPNVPPFVNDLKTLDAGIGIWIKMTAADTLELSGTEPTSSTKSLCTGWNLVGYPSLQTREITDAVSGIEGAYDVVYAFEATDESDKWKTYDPSVPPFVNDLKQMNAGFGYWIKANQAIEWEVDN